MVHATMSDSSLIQLYIAGKEQALEVLIQKHQSKIFGFIYSKVGDRDLANDIFQDTFIKVIHTFRANRYNEEGKFLPWVIRISHNLVIDHFRREKRMRMQRDTNDFSVFDFLMDDSPIIEKALIKSQIDESMQFLIDGLPEDQKEVLCMRIYQDLSFKEIAEQTDVSINTALGRMRYALINLRKIIEQRNVILFD
ncbi:sigma-70 family RNA polymerase sigma factor [Myroides guanonis]|uniref:RNA polymerase, sigma subunit, ECF family n=1 Tax=Myroides guanonis TaxID=1150112 RepID=A0A1I3LB35_9FLAO|nr:sigma-70 family RNA polymerase sigma factor [Myroides guanonis]SFI81964.1 RNA polymerase, sigma subunit, ECF family [Myroides guanonis]